MKIVKRMMFGGAAKAAGAVKNAVTTAARKAPAPPPMARAMMDKMLAGLPKGSTVAAPAPAPATLKRPPFLAPTPAPTSSGRGSIFGGGGSRNQPPPVQPPPASTVMSGFGALARGEGRAMANRMGRMGMKEGGSVSSASKRADGCATKGKTKGKMV